MDEEDEDGLTLVTNREGVEEEGGAWEVKEEGGRVVAALVT